MPDPVAVNFMFGRIARRYDLANRLLSGGTDQWWRRRLVSAVARAHPVSILDIATGSGDVAFALADRMPRAQITGVDFCAPMLKEAERKKAAAQQGNYVSVQFREGDGMALPFPDDAFDAVTISFGLRNMADRGRSLREMYRVLRPGGRLFVLEFSQPQRWLRPFYLFYLRRILPLVAGKLTGDREAYVYLNETIEQFPSASALTKEIQAAGFAGVSACPMSFCIVALHEGVKE
jgi:demethylmenaquinone methyltransferase/2-methoxy-6-polyprenyl-1,4-benzoquinol methylase